MATKEQIDRIIIFLGNCGNLDIEAGISQVFGLGSEAHQTEFIRRLRAAIDGPSDSGGGP